MLQIRRLGVILVVFLAFTVPPLAAAQDTIDNPSESTPTTLYLHIFDTFHKFVINTQPMDAEFFELGGTNFPTISGTAVNSATGNDFDLNTIYGYSTAGPVEYDFIENGRPRFHPERGIASDVLLDRSVAPLAYIYLDVRDVIGNDAAPNYLPNFNVRVVVQEGDDPGRDADLDLGRDIMSGDVIFDLADGDFNANAFFTEPTPIPVVPGNDVIAGTGGTNPITGNQMLLPDENGIVEVVIPMSVLEDKISKVDAFNIRIDWYQTVDGIVDDDQVAEGYFRLSATPEQVPRLEFAITNPVYLSFIHPQVAANTLLIHAGANSPWGTYDLDLENVELKITGPATPQSIRKVLSSNEHVHGLHDQDAQLTYLWDFRDEGAPDGEYTIHMSVTNDAGSAVATGTAKFIIEGETATGIDTDGNIVEPTLDSGDVEAPGVGALGALALLGAALVLARRRMNE
jgi:hypothetical protein